MAKRLYSIKKATAKIILGNNDIMAEMLGSIARRHEVRVQDVLLVSGALQQRMPKGKSAPRKKVDMLCLKLAQGELYVQETDAELVLMRREPGDPEPKKAGRKREKSRKKKLTLISSKPKLDPKGLVMFVFLLVLGAAALGAIGYVLYLLFLHLTS